MNPFIERTIQCGILHATLTYNFKNYTNITFLNDVKLNLCDYLNDIIKASISRNISMSMLVVQCQTSFGQ